MAATEQGTRQAGAASPVDFAAYGDYGDFAKKQPPRQTGAFERPAYRFQGRITADGSSGCPAAAGRYPGRPRLGVP
jgi:glutathionyl-hydroquinone reductase